MSESVSQLASRGSARDKPTKPPVEVWRARVAVSYYFFLAGVVFGTWASRIPAVKGKLELSEGELSLALLGVGVGSVAAAFLVGRVVDRFGSASVMIPTGVLGSLALIPLGYVPSLMALAAVLFVFGLFHGSLDVSMNTHAVEVERAYGRPIMSSFHAVFSIGGFAGAGIGGLAASVELSAGTTFVIVGLFFAVFSALAGFWRLPASARIASTVDNLATDGAGKRAAKSSRFSWTALLLAALALSCFIGEGSIGDWGAVYLRDSQHTSHGFAAVGFASFSVAMAAGRFAGDRLTLWLGPVLLVRISASLATVSLAIVLLVNAPIVTAIGFAGFGLGLSVIVPQIFTAAGNIDPARAGSNLAKIAGAGYIGFLAGPVAIGGLATLVTLPVALGVPVVLAAALAIAAGALRDPRAGKPGAAGKPVEVR